MLVLKEEIKFKKKITITIITNLLYSEHNYYIFIFQFLNVPSVNALPTCVGALSKPLDVAKTPIMTPPVQVHPCDVSTVTEVADPAVTVTPCISAPMF